MKAVLALPWVCLLPCPHLPFGPSSPLHSFPAARLFWRHLGVLGAILNWSGCRRSFSCWAPAAWGQLPVSVQHAASVSSFGSSLRIFLFLGIFSSVPLPWSVSVCVHVCQCVLSLICCQYTYVRRICKCLGPSADGIQTHKRFRRTLFIRTKTTCTFWG